MKENIFRAFFKYSEYEPSGSHPKKGESARWKSGGSHS